MYHSVHSALKFLRKDYLSYDIYIEKIGRGIHFKTAKLQTIIRMHRNRLSI